jgi:hypothetical protein
MHLIRLASEHDKQRATVAWASMGVVELDNQLNDGVANSVRDRVFGRDIEWWRNGSAPGGLG